VVTAQRGYTQSRIYMDTIVSIEVSDPGADEASVAERVERAFGWFAEVEQRCSRFDPDSELSRLCTQVGTPVTVSPLLFRAIEFALGVAEASNGAFDPTIGHAMQTQGFNRNYLTGKATTVVPDADMKASYRDVAIDAEASSVTLRRPLLLDLGAVAKGFAIDLAAAELSDCAGFAINAGGDVRVQGLSAEGIPWRIGIRHPRHDDEVVDVLSLSEGALCTSGDYERRSAQGGHILQPKTQSPVAALISVSVLAPSAMLADALSTAAFVLGPKSGLEFLEQQGVEGLLITDALERISTKGLSEDRP
jgi:thiamine biosynthesis lipoprotein